MQISYLDNSATTKPCEQSIKYLNDAICNNWGNPSSLHSLGINAEEIINSCKKTIATFISCREDEILFTSGGTEANNIAILGAALSRQKRGNRIITTAFEHPSVLETVKALETKGFEVVYLKPQKNGAISLEELKNAINQKTILVSIMLVNNEIGAIQPVSEVAKIVKSSGAPALIHCDAVQGFGKLDIKVSSLGVDLMTFSGHKIHAPKGIGALYKKKGVNILPNTFGGGQQNGLRSGTEPVPLIAALEGAIKALPPISQQINDIQKLRDLAAKKLSMLGVCINSPNDALPYILNVSLEGYRSETLLHFLDAKGVYVSSGSACSKGATSQTLKALSLSAGRIDSALRISFSRYNTETDIMRLCDALEEAKQKIKKV
ncbi:MAG: cysteine desulfurase [Clostridia bacterium]|nr:cysteine desulfurase [Clostridia bacterium]